jgi:hypothetical protein
MYLVKLPDEVRVQLAALPATALAAFAEAMVVLEVAPWGGDPYNRERPEASIRTLAFGEHAEGLLVYPIVEHAREVGVIELMWVG